MTFPMDISIGCNNTTWHTYRLDRGFIDRYFNTINPCPKGTLTEMSAPKGGFIGALYPLGRIWGHEFLWKYFSMNPLFNLLFIACIVAPVYWRGWYETHVFSFSFKFVLGKWGHKKDWWWWLNNVPVEICHQVKSGFHIFEYAST